VAAPAAVLEGICAFLALAWHPGLVDAVFTSPHGKGLGDPKVNFSGRIHGRSVGSGRGLPLGILPEAVRRRASSLMAELGYPEVGAEGPLEAPPVAGGPDISDSGSAGPSPELRRLFAETLPRLAREHADMAGAIDGSYKFVVGGGGGGEWAVDLTGGGCRIVEGGAAAPYSVIVSATDLLAIVNGSLNAFSAWASGRVEVLGEPPEESLKQLVRLLSMA
ncbi:MAG: SCP2 sterol-binding domain-containing protein, partial [Acidobacteriota bacterium]|nr:SCP2 sterol-binding domain-containing protein [Acidobacteriota bacterium]